MEEKEDQNLMNELYEKLLNEKKEYEEKMGKSINMRICIFNNEVIFVEVVSKEYLETIGEQKTFYLMPASLIILSDTDNNKNQDVSISPIIEFPLLEGIQKKLEGHHFLNNNNKIMKKFALGLLKKSEKLICSTDLKVLNFDYIKDLFDEYYIDKIIGRIYFKL